MRIAGSLEIIERRLVEADGEQQVHKSLLQHDCLLVRLGRALLQ